MSEVEHSKANCIFCKIIAGDIPSSKVYEDDRVFAFLDISPVTKGHTLVVPKDHYSGLLDTPPELLCEIAMRMPAVAAAVKAAAGADGFHVIQNNEPAAGQVVFHIHYHIIPRCDGDCAFAPWRHVKYAQGEAESLAGRISSELGSK